MKIAGFRPGIWHGQTVVAFLPLSPYPYRLRCLSAIASCEGGQAEQVAKLFQAQFQVLEGAVEEETL